MPAEEKKGHPKRVRVYAQYVCIYIWYIHCIAVSVRNVLCTSLSQMSERDLGLTIPLGCICSAKQKGRWKNFGKGRDPKKIILFIHPLWMTPCINTCLLIALIWLDLITQVTTTKHLTFLFLCCIACWMMHHNVCC